MAKEEEVIDLVGDEDDVEEVVPESRKRKRTDDAAGHKRVREEDDGEEEYRTMDTVVDSRIKYVEPIPNATPGVTTSIDGGTANCSITWLNAMTGRARIQLHDFSVWNGVKHDMSAGFGERIVYVVRKYERLFRHVILVTVERMDHPLTNKSVQEATLQLAQTIRALHPDIPLRLTRPQDVRKYWDTSGKSYEERKDNSTWTDMLAIPAEKAIFESTFYKKDGKGSCEDPYESCQLAIWSYHNRAWLMEPLQYPEKRKSPNELLEVIVSVKVGHPDETRCCRPPDGKKKKKKKTGTTGGKPRKPRAKKPKKQKRAKST